MILHRATRVPVPLDEIWAFFSTPANLQMLTPSWLSFRIVSAPERALVEGDELEYRIRIAGVPQRWRSTITLWNEGKAFADYQDHGPYDLWHHFHLFQPVVDGTEIVDLVRYRLPLGQMGRLGGSLLVRAQLKMIFDFRRSKIREVFGAGDE